MKPQQDIPKENEADTTHFQAVEPPTHTEEWQCFVESDKGYFMHESGLKTTRLSLRILNYRVEEGILFSAAYREPETVVQAVFMDEDNQVGTIVFRTYSRDNFLQLVNSLALKRIPLATQVITASMKEMKSKAGHAFFAVHFTAENNSQSEFEKIRAFVTSLPHILTCFRQLPKPE